MSLTPGPSHWGRAFFGELYRRTTIEHFDPARTRAEADAIGHLLRAPPAARILDLGCGHGRHALELSRRGYRVTGLDLDEASLALAATSARSEGLSLALVRADLAVLPLSPGVLDGAYAWYSSLFLFDDDVHVALLARVRAALKPGASFVQQSLEPDHLRGKGRETLRWHLLRGGVVEETSSFDPLTGRDEGTRTLTIGDRVITARFSIRYPSPDELEGYAQRAGFSAWRALSGAEVGLSPELLLLHAVA